MGHLHPLNRGTVRCITGGPCHGQMVGSALRSPCSQGESLEPARSCHAMAPMPVGPAYKAVPVYADLLLGIQGWGMTCKGRL